MQRNKTLSTKLALLQLVLQLLVKQLGNKLLIL
jgi:hypothetical protein